MGEAEGESPVEFLYEYNIETDRWTENLELDISTALGYGKSAVFMIGNTIKNAGGSSWNYKTHNNISALNLEWSDAITVGYLPANAYYEASVYYKNSIYIHGGAYSFGNLPLRSIVKNNLIVINLMRNVKVLRICVYRIARKEHIMKMRDVAYALKEVTQIE
jgi:hypothetical protein